MDEVKNREKARAAVSLIPNMPDKLKYYVLGYVEGYAVRIEEHEQQERKEDRPA